MVTTSKWSGIFILVFCLTCHFFAIMFYSQHGAFVTFWMGFQHSVVASTISAVASVPICSLKAWIIAINWSIKIITNNNNLNLWSVHMTTEDIISCLSIDHHQPFHLSSTVNIFLQHVHITYITNKVLHQGNLMVCICSVYPHKMPHCGRCLSWQLVNLSDKEHFLSLYSELLVACDVNPQWID